MEEQWDLCGAAPMGGAAEEESRTPVAHLPRWRPQLRLHIPCHIQSFCYHRGGPGPAAEKVGTLPLHSPVAFAHLLLGGLGNATQLLRAQLAPLTGAELLQGLSVVL